MGHIEVEGQASGENSVWDDEFLLVIKNQLRRSDPDTTHGRKPLAHFLVADNPADVVEFESKLTAKLRAEEFSVLPPLEFPIEDGYLGFRGSEIFDGIYDAIRERGIPTKKTDVQIVRIPDISGCFADSVQGNNSGRSTHDFLQIPLEDSRWVKDDPRATVAQILDRDPNLPRVVLLMHLGRKAGETAYKRGLRDIVNNHFKQDMWVAKTQK